MGSLSRRLPEPRLRLGPVMCRLLWHATCGRIYLASKGRSGDVALARLQALKLLDGNRAATLIGGALGCYIARSLGHKLKRRGVSLLAKHRASILARYDVSAAVEALRPTMGAG